MKKFISLFLCVIMLFSLTACKERIIGEDLENREDNTDKDTAIKTLNMYVIAGENTSDDAQKTVLTMINVYLKETYEVQLEIFYSSAEDHESNVWASLAEGADENKRADIVLIDSVEMFDTLYQANKLAPLTSFYNSKDYQKFNAIVEDKLLASSLIKDVVPGANGTPDTYVDNYYTVPNNHRIGEYKYIVIDKAEARDKLHYSTSKIEAMNDQRDIAEYKEKIGDDKVQLVSGQYETKLYLEYGCNNFEELQAKIGQYYDDHVAEAGVDVNSDEYKSRKSAYIADNSQIITDNKGNYVKAPIEKINFVNIASYPNATKMEAFESAYAVIKTKTDVGNLTDQQQASVDKHYTKCIDIIYALNNDPQLRNMLQYGYVGTNYNFIKDEKHQNTNYITLKGEIPGDPVTYSNVYYNMNLIHTGNPYISYYCNEQGWNETEHANILKQNAASYTLLEKVTEESLKIKELNGTVFDITDSSVDQLLLWDNGVKHGDVTITWASNSDDVTLVNAENKLYIVPVVSQEDGAEAVNEVLTQEVSANITATLVCTDSESGESAELVVEFTVKVIKPAEAPAA